MAETAARNEAIPSAPSERSQKEVPIIIFLFIFLLSVVFKLK